jgi:hypothetical protein
MAERAGFEPARLIAYTISGRAHSTKLCDLSKHVTRSISFSLLLATYTLERVWKKAYLQDTLVLWGFG